MTTACKGVTVNWCDCASSKVRVSCTAPSDSLKFSLRIGFAFLYSAWKSSKPCASYTGSLMFLSSSSCTCFQKLGLTMLTLSFSKVSKLCELAIAARISGFLSYLFRRSDSFMSLSITSHAYRLFSPNLSFMCSRFLSSLMKLSSRLVSRRLSNIYLYTFKNCSWEP